MSDWLEIPIPGKNIRVPAEYIPEDLVESILFWMGHVAREAYNHALSIRLGVTEKES